MDRNASNSGGGSGTSDAKPVHTSEDRRILGLLELGLEANALSPEPRADDLPQQPMPVTYIGGKYELGERIGQGGMGVVFKVLQSNLNRPVALKVLQAGSYATDAARERFEREAQAAAGLRHANIVQVHDFGESNGQLYYVMDYIEGKNLSKKVGAAQLTPRQAATCMKTVAEAVHFMHQKGVFHRDLKPSNILIDQDGKPWVADFGLATQLGAESNLSASGQFLGSPGYLPPEQASLDRGSIGPWSDVYSIGATLYFMLTGQPPFQAGSIERVLHQVLEIDPVSPRSLNPGVPEGLAFICMKCLEKEPQWRYQSAQELAADLDNWLQDRPIKAGPRSVRRVVGLWLKRNRLEVALGSVVLLALAALVLQVHVGAPAPDKLQSARELFARDEATAGLAVLADVVRDHPGNRVAAPYLVNALTFGSYALPETTLPHDKDVSAFEYSPSLDFSPLN